MALFSERYKYIEPSNVMKREVFERDLQIAWGNCFYRFYEENCNVNYWGYEDICRIIWTDHLNCSIREFYYGGDNDLMEELLSKNAPWYLKFDVVEYFIRVARAHWDKLLYPETINILIKGLNYELQKLHYGYRIIDGQITPITDDQEVKEIEQTMANADNNVRTHINNALAQFTKRPNPDYRNAVKEAISGVEALCRELTGETTLGDALKNLEKNGIKTHPMLRIAFDKLYNYTNQKDTGIRHALLDDAQVPTEAEAHYMIVSCCAFVNYITQLRGKI